VWLHIFIEFSLIFILSELSYRFIEEPMRKFDYGQLLSKIKDWFALPFKNKQKIIGLLGVLVSLIAFLGIITAPSASLNTKQKEFKAEIEANKKVAKDSKKGKKSATTTSTDLIANDLLQTYSNDTDHVMKKYDLSKKQVEEARQTEVTAFGDSVILGSTKNIQEVFPKIIMDADVGRQLYDSAELLKKLEKKNQLKDDVILALGSNGYANAAQFDELMDIIGDRKVYLINVCVPTQRWQNDNNDLFKQMAKKYDNISLVDWYGLSNKQTAWFREDQVHPNDVGRVEYTTLLAKKILK